MKFAGFLKILRLQPRDTMKTYGVLLAFHFTSISATLRILLLTIYTRIWQLCIEIFGLPILLLIHGRIPDIDTIRNNLLTSLTILNVFLCVELF